MFRTLHLRQSVISQYNLGIISFYQISIYLDSKSECRLSKRSKWASAHLLFNSVFIIILQLLNISTYLFIFLYSVWCIYVYMFMFMYCHKNHKLIQHSSVITTIKLLDLNSIAKSQSKQPTINSIFINRLKNFQHRI